MYPQLNENNNNCYKKLFLLSKIKAKLHLMQWIWTRFKVNIIKEPKLLKWIILQISFYNNIGKNELKSGIADNKTLILCTPKNSYYLCFFWTQRTLWRSTHINNIKLYSKTF